MKNQVFISYSHKDNVWLGRLKTHLSPWGKEITPWSDERIRPSTRWQTEIRSALEDSCAAILLVSPNFLASDFIMHSEVPEILAAADNRGLKVFWILISDCAYEKIPLAKIQAATDPKTPLDQIANPGKRNTELKHICEAIASALGPQVIDPEPPPIRVSESRAARK